MVLNLPSRSVRNIFSKKDKNIIICSTSVFLILFLNLFSPFGIKNSDANFIFILIVSFYGLMAGMILYLFEYGIKKYIPALNKNTIQLYQHCMWYLMVVFVISIANYSYYSILNVLFQNHQFQFPPKSFPFFLWTTFLVGLVIGAGLVLYFRSVYQRKEVVHVKNIIASKQVSGCIQIWSENKKESFSVDLDNLLFLEKKDNYVSIFYENETGIQKKLIRASLRDIEEKYIKHPLLRCHISYIVNLTRVINYSGNSKGLKLSISNFNRAVPVSSRYYQKVITELNQISLSTPLAS